MSRAAAGFADFFPTAPSVLQQKQKKRAALEQQQARSKGGGATGAPCPSRTDTALTPPATSEPSPERPPPANAVVNGGGGDRGYTHVPTQEDNDLIQGDLLNGVGSASSHTSTVSSVFSGSNHFQTSSTLGLSAAAHALTPLTNTDSSPRERNSSPPLSKSAPASRALPDDHDDCRTLAKPRAETDASLVVENHETRLGARAWGGRVKGEICTYDPELDKKLTSKEKKKLKPIYRKFGSQVRS